MTWPMQMKPKREHFFITIFFFHGPMKYIYKSSMLLPILDVSIFPVLSCVVFSPYTVINTSWERSSVFPVYVPTKPPCCPSIGNGSGEPICKHRIVFMFGDAIDSFDRTIKHQFRGRISDFSATSKL